MKGVGGVCEMCMCLARGSVGGEWVNGYEDWGWTLPILWEKRECLTCVCVGCDGVGGVGGECVWGVNQGMEGWRFVMSGLFVYSLHYCQTYLFIVSIYTCR